MSTFERQLRHFLRYRFGDCAWKCVNCARPRDPAEGIGVFCDGGASPNPLAPARKMIAIIDEHRAIYGVELIYKLLPDRPINP